MKNNIATFLVCLFCIAALLASGCAKIPRQLTETAKIPDEARKCIECHKRKQISNIALRDWQFSTHAERGVTCVDCHIPVSEASNDIIGRTTSCDNKDVRRSVSPKNCEECHSDQAEQFASGKHSKAWTVLQDVLRTHEVSKSFNIEQDCSGCHRIGRDDGKCDSCHTRHRFTAAEARRPEACRTCHMGPAHPEWETYSTSKHGSIYSIEGQNWFWDKRIAEWYKAPLIESPVIPRAPVCVTCHMPEGNHAVDITDHGKTGREKMVTICSQCHTSSFSADTLEKADNMIKSCDELLGKAVNIVESLYRDGIIQKTKRFFPHIDVLRFENFKNPIEERLYKIFIEHRMKTYMGAFHINPTYQHDYGLAELKNDFNEIENMANDLRKEGSEK